MGKWAEVKCNCPNRIPRMMNKSQPWELTYDCGHRDGMLYQTWPGYLHDVACLLKEVLKDEPDLWRSFEVLGKLERWPRGDEFFGISSEEAVGLELELKEVLELHEGTRAFSYRTGRKWHEYWEQFFSEAWRQEDAGSVQQIIDDGLKLCRAAIETGNPIEFTW